MRNRFIEIVSVILVVVIVLSVPSFAEFSNSGISNIITGITEILTGTDIDGEDEMTTTEPETTDEATTEPTTEEPTTEPPTEPPTEPLENFDEVDDGRVVARMYICTQQVGLGHAWIYIESMFNGEMTVGCYTLKPYQGVSMGTFLFSRADGGGLYYNVEAYCANKWGLKNKSWLGTDLTKKQLVKVSDRIKDWNYWDFYFNCTFFAAEIWNCVSKKKIVPIMFPFFVKWQILAKGGNKNTEMLPVEPEDCYKQKGRGDRAYLIQVKERTLNSKLW